MDLQSLNPKEITRIKELIAELYSHIFLESPSKDASYFHGYFLDRLGYEDCYRDLITILFNDPKIQNKWSLSAIKNRVSGLLSELGELKVSSQELLDNQEPNFENIASKFLMGFQSDFEEREYFTIINNLVLKESLKIGSVTFCPIQDRIEEIMKDEIFSTLHELSGKNNCLASSHLDVEFEKGVEIHLERVDEALNILRYMGALVWYNESPRQIYIAGRQHTGVHDVFTIDPVEWMGWVGEKFQNPIPFYIDGDFLAIANSFHLKEIVSWLNNPTPLQRSVILAMQWFGDATRELNSIQAFMKYYVAIEILLKKNQDRAKEKLPNRLIYILRKMDKDGLKQYFEGLIGQRNAVFHEGKPSQETPETLARVLHHCSRDVINNIVQHMQIPHIYLKGPKIGWNTKEELIDCIDARVRESNEREEKMGNFCKKLS